MLVLSFPTRSTANSGRTSSYASITKLNRDPLIEQPRPNLSLLETNPLLSPTSETQHLTPSNHIQVVSAEEALKIRESIENPLETPPSQFLSAPTLETPPPPSTPPTNEIKLDKETIDAIARVEKAEQKIKEKLDKNENLIDSEGKRLKEGAKKGIKEVRKEVKKRDDHARKVVRTYPGAVVGLMGFANVAILGTVSYFAYKNWDKPTWDRKLVLGTAVGLVGLVGAEGYTGYWEYERDFKEPKGL